MNAGAGTYASTEATNAQPLKTLEAEISQEEATISQDSRISRCKIGLLARPLRN